MVIHMPGKTVFKKSYLQQVMPWAVHGPRLALYVASESPQVSRGQYMAGRMISCVLIRDDTVSASLCCLTNRQLGRRRCAPGEII